MDVGSRKDFFRTQTHYHPKKGVDFEVERNLYSEPNLGDTLVGTFFETSVLCERFTGEVENEEFFHLGDTLVGTFFETSVLCERFTGEVENEEFFHL